MNRNPKNKKFDLQERLIDHAVRIISVSEQLPNTKTGKHISSQIFRSGTSPAPNYEEAQSAKSVADFIHKFKVALKELRETDVWLQIIVKSEIIQPKKLIPLLK